MAGGPANAQFAHPGCLSTQNDLDRMAAKVANNEQPWKAGYDRLVQAPYGQLGHTPSPQTILYASGSQPDNYINLARDAAAAYQVALRYHVSGDPAYAAKAVSILMAWANTHTSWNGNTNVSLRAGLYGYQLACAGELVRNYSGWDPADFATFQNYVRTHFYKIVSPNDVDRGFLFHHHGTCWSHYWANWELAAMATVIATGVLCDDEAIFQEGIDYFYNGVGVGRISELLHYLHPNGLGQSQEFGRDQGHATMLVPLLGTFCEIAWNQGIDLYSELDNAFLAMSENLAKYNLWYDTPYVPYINCEYLVLTNIGTESRGNIRAGMDLVYNHYVNRMGMAAPYTKEAAETIRPEGGGGQYGPNSGGFDQLGFTTLTHSLDPIAEGVPPSHLRAHIKGGKITLSWRGSAYAKSFNVKRATSPGGPYINLAKVGAKNTTCIDTGVPAGTTCYYVVSANNPDGESAHSAEISAAHDHQLYGTLIGTTGSAGNWGATRGLAMDGSLKNFMDAWAPEGGWVGLDLGSGVSAVITGVKYCPQPGGGQRLVGGVVEAANSPDFSDAVNLFTVNSAPPSGVFTTQPIANGNAFRYVRFRALPNNYCTLAEVQFIGNVTGGMTPPAHAPGGLAVSSPWTGEATLTWSSVPGATDYVLKRAATPGGPYTVIDYNPPWDMDYTERRLAAGTYYYVVSALNSVGETADSNEVSIEIGASSTPTLVTHLAFDETSGTVAADSSGNDRNGALVGGPTWDAGTLNNAVNLDGVDDHVDLPDGILDGAGACTIAAWVNPDTLSTWARLFDFGTGTTSYMFLAPMAGGSDALRFAITTNGNGSEQQINAGSTLATGVWSHVAVTLNGSTGILYVNGVEVGRNNSMTLTPASLGYTTQNYIGKAQFPDPYFDGRVDEFYVYNFALDPTEVAGLMAFTEPDLDPDPEPSDTTPPAAPAGLAATAGHEAVTLDWADNTEPDIARYAVHRSTTPGGPYAAIATGVTFSAYEDVTVANGTTYHYVVTASDTSLNESGDSVEAFAAPLAPPPPDAPASLTATVVSTSRIDLAWSAASGASGYTIKRSTTSGGPYDTLATGHLTTAYSDTTAAPRITYYYVVAAVNGGGESISTEVSARIDDTHLHLKFDETSGATAADSSGNERNATLVNGPAFSSGRMDNSLEFSASSSQYATLPAGLVSTLNDFTISIWVKPASSGASWARVFDFGSGTATNMFLTPQSGVTGKPRFAIKINNSAEQIIDASDGLAAGVWTHIAVTLSGNTGTLYLNGVASGKNTAMTFKPSEMGSTPQNYLGKSQYADPYLDGALDDFRIYGSAMSASEVGLLVEGPLAAPQNVTATVVSGSQINLSWTAAGGAAGYNVKRATVSGGPYTTVAAGVGATGYNDTGLADGTAYYYVVSAVNADGESAGSTEASATTLPPPPVITSALSAGGTNGSAFSYQITARNSPTSYEATGLPAGLSANTSNGQIDGTPTVTGTFSANISATNAGGTGSATLTITVTPPAPEITSALSASGTNGSAFSYQITASNSPTSYGAAGLPAGLSVNTSTGLIDGAPSETGTFSATISATNDGGTGSATLTITVTPAAPASLTATGNNAAVSLNWTASPSATSYNVKRSLTSGSDYTTVASGVTATSFSDTGLANWTTYFYVVTAVNAAGESVNSIEASAMTTDLRAHLEFDETSGAAAADSSGGGWTGSLVNGPVWADGAINNAVDLDGTDDYVNLTAGMVNGLHSFTVSTWVYLDSVSGWSRIFDFGTATTVNMFLTPKSGDSNVVRYAITTNGGEGEQQIDGTAALPAGTWKHVAVTWAGNVGILYVDGVEVGRNSAMTLDPASLGSMTQNYIGKSQYADPYLDGRVDDFRVYARALDASEIAAMVSAGMPVPSAPADLGATVVSGSQIDLNWTVVTSATSYSVKRSMVSGSDFTTIASELTEASYSDTGLDNSTTYYYVVTAANLGGESDNSTEASATTLPPAPAITSALSASGTNGSAFSYQITASNSPTSYGATDLPAGLSVNTNTGLIDGTPSETGTFSATISATNDGGTGSATLMITVTPAAPTSLTATGNNAAVSLNWTASPSATSYNVKRSLTSGSDYTTVASGVTTTNYNDTGLANDTTYYYVVTASNSGGESASSTEASATTYTAIQNWRLTHFGTTSGDGNAADNADPDGDGWTNAQEFVSGTDPNDRTSLLKVTQMQASGSDILLSFPTVTGKTYRVERSDTLQNGSWTTVEGGIGGTGGAVQVTDTGAAEQPQRFYRIVVNP